MIINGKEYKLKMSIAAFLLYEGLRDKPYEGKMVSDNFYLFYSALAASNAGDFALTTSDLANFCDDNPALLYEFLNLLVEYNRFNAQFMPDNKPGEAKKKQKYQKSTG